MPKAARRPVLLHLSPDVLVPHPDNPRKHSPEQIAAIARSMQTFGVNAPILVDNMNRMIAGHGRLEAAKRLGRRKVPVIRLEHLSEQQAKAYMLADNKLGDRSSWDDEKLALVLKELSVVALDFELEATGFEAPEIDLRIQSLDSAEDIEDPADESEPDQRHPVSRLGDQWVCGDHWLVCGNALEPSSYDPLPKGGKAAAVFSDPPYNVRVNGHVTGKGATKHREFPMASGEMSEDEFEAFLLGAFREAATHTHECATFFSCMDWRHMFAMESVIRALDFKTVNLCVWVKTNGGMGSLYRSSHELVFVFGRLDRKRVNNVQLGKFGRNRTNVWNYPGMNSFARRGRRRALDLHPTAKPVAMIADAILDVTKRGDIVLDPFCGSGATLLAAERTGRRAFGIELDPGHVDTAIGRWERMTKRLALHPSGKTFAEVQAERTESEIKA